MSLLRAVVFAFLSLLEPFVTGLLSALALLGLFTAGFFHWALPPAAPHHTGTLLAISAACVVGAMFYRVITRWVEPR